jgi:DNA-binding transcriptional MerR regulator/methylmalonyl-CoA mutase cobalamin-binding subunit
MENVLYPIRAVSRLTGVSLHTLRAWERRYRVVDPIRDDRGRLYTKADIERISLLNTAIENGHSIGRLAQLSESELKEVASQPASAAGDLNLGRPIPATQSNETVVAPHALIDAVDRLDHAAAERELALLAGVLSPRDLIYRVALPLLREIGSSWHAGTASIAQEHMTSALLRNLLGGLISRYHKRSSTAKILFTTPTGEQHEFGLLVSAMLAAGGGLGIIYLGPNLPAEEIITAAVKTGARAVVLGFVGADAHGHGMDDLEKVAHQMPTNIEIWVGGVKDKTKLEKISRTRALLMEDFESLEQNLVRLGARF